MPSITSGKVLVTGANGFIGMWVVKAHLEAGYAVKAVVRSQAKANHMHNVFKDHIDSLEVIAVADPSAVRPPANYLGAVWSETT